MGTRKSKAELFTTAQVDEILKYYSIHTAASTMRQFNITRSAFNILSKKYNIIPHTADISEVLKHIEQDGYDKFSEDKIQSICADYAECQDEYIIYNKYNIKKYYLVYILAKYNITYVPIKKN